MEIIKKENGRKEEQIIEKNKKLSSLEDFVSSEGFNEFYKKYLASVIQSLESDILNDESKDEAEKLYTRKYLKILLRKELIKLYTRPIDRLKLLSKSIDIIGSTE